MKRAIIVPAIFALSTATAVLPAAAMPTAAAPGAHAQAAAADPGLYYHG